MGKVQVITRTIVLLFIGLLIFSIIVPLDFQYKNIEEIYKEHQGLFWMLGIFTAAVLGVLTFINSIFQNEKNKLTEQIVTQNETIENQNVKIIASQETYMEHLQKITDSINENNEKDLKRLEFLQKLSNKIDRHEDKIAKQEDRMSLHIDMEKRLRATERLIKMHDKEIRDLKK